MNNPIQSLQKTACATGLVCSLLLLAGCAGSRPTTSLPGETAEHSADDVRVNADDVRDRLLFEVDRWLGSEYRWGGTDRSGFDCSGFVRRVYRDAFDQNLPRTTGQQMRIGASVGRSDLQMADLVFFRTSSRTDHVGVYLGGGEFAHASTSSGVMVSHLGERYWSDAYRTARRVLTIAGEDKAASISTPPMPQAPRAETPGIERLSSARVGW